MSVLRGSPESIEDRTQIARGKTHVPAPASAKKWEARAAQREREAHEYVSGVSSYGKNECAWV